MLYESKTFHLEFDDGVLTLWLDFRGRSSQTITLQSLNELSLVLDRVARFPAADVILLRSSRPGVFLDEFDIAELSRFSTPLEFAAFARRGQDVTRKLTQLPSPTVAIIEGRCIGGGLEIALACRFRFAIDSCATTFAFSDVGRGLIPCWGGTCRLPRVVGTRAAARLLSGESSLGPAAAHKAGLVDRLSNEQQMQVDLPTFVDRLRDSPNRGWTDAAHSAMRSWFGSSVLRSMQRPLANEPDSPRGELLRAMTAGFSSEGEGLTAERAAVTRLADRQATRRMLATHVAAVAPVRVFPEPANPLSPLPRRIGIVGGGEFGTALACRLARSDHEIFVQERSSIEADEFARRVTSHLANEVSTGNLSPAAARSAENRIQGTTDWVGFANAELVVEAASEDPGIKRNLFQALEERVRPRIILATASTTVPVESIQAEMSRPGRIAGFHLPNPAGNRPIAEIIGAAMTDPGTTAALSIWCRSWGLLPVRVADRPGRLVRLVQLAYLSEGVRLVAEGLPIEQIDAGCRKFGMKHGPLEWCDEIGLDRIAELTAQLQLARDDSFARNLLFQRLLPYGFGGKAVGEGFYRYGAKTKPNRIARMLLWQDLDHDGVAPYLFDPDHALQQGIERMILRTVNQAAVALADEPDSNPATVDMALTLGMGWASRIGGPLRFADDLGLGHVAERLSFFAERYGAYMAPCDELLRRAEAGESFYGDNPVEPAPQVRRMVG
jgi:3-hydroxyacyl-CoA dehydrogenase / enoyl-CoA hydratase / 3-hydroxybutyryl-CoA epimerase